MSIEGLLRPFLAALLLEKLEYILGHFEVTRNAERVDVKLRCRVHAVEQPFLLVEVGNLVRRPIGFDLDQLADDPFAMFLRSERVVDPSDASVSSNSRSVQFTTTVYSGVAPALTVISARPFGRLGRNTLAPTPKTSMST